jgi:hypothetical protein
MIVMVGSIINKWKNIKGIFLRTLQKKVAMQELFFKNLRHNNVWLTYPCVSLILHV